LQSTDTIHDVIIVGSGPSGVGAAMGFVENGIMPLVLDVGKEASRSISIGSNLYEYRKTSDAFDLMIGENYEVINHVLRKRSPSPKLSSPLMQYVTEDTEKLSPIDERGSAIIQSFSKGGLANAWGAALYRVMDDELADLPVKAAELDPFYDKLTEEIGISGGDDDLTQFFGSTEHLLPPLVLSRKSRKIYRNYERKREKLNAKGIYIGRSRLGVLSRKHHGREAFKYQNLEMWIPNLPYLYTPAFTVQKLLDAGRIAYRGSVLVRSWSRDNGCIVVHAEHADDGTPFHFKCKRLILAAGAVNSARIVLTKKRDFDTSLPLLENTLMQIPLILPSFIGRPLDKEALALTNLNIVYVDKMRDLKLQGSIIELSSPARAVFYDMLPLSARDNLKFIRLFLPSLMVVFLYFPSSASNVGHVMLKRDNTLEVSSVPGKVDKDIIRRIIRAFIGLGAISHSMLVQPSDHSIHYGGTLPMVRRPDREYHCDSIGELYNEPGVHVADGALFSYIPSKNYSLTLMANAMRIADRVSQKVIAQ